MPDHGLETEECGTGYEVARLIEEGAVHGTIPELEWRVPSANPVGRENIEAAMKNAERYWNEPRIR